MGTIVALDANFQQMSACRRSVLSVRSSSADRAVPSNTNRVYMCPHNWYRPIFHNVHTQHFDRPMHILITSPIASTPLDACRSSVMRCIFSGKHHTITIIGLPIQISKRLTIRPDVTWRSLTLAWISVSFKLGPITRPLQLTNNNIYIYSYKMGRVFQCEHNIM